MASDCIHVEEIGVVVSDRILIDLIDAVMIAQILGGRSLRQDLGGNGEMRIIAVKDGLTSSDLDWPIYVANELALSRCSRV